MTNTEKQKELIDAGWLWIMFANQFVHPDDKNSPMSNVKKWDLEEAHAELVGV